jgi:hypothetical protein
MSGQDAQRLQAFIFARRANVERYEKLLRTSLTDQERAFIQKRLQEEVRALTEPYRSDLVN